VTFNFGTAKDILNFRLQQQTNKQQLAQGERRRRRRVVVPEVYMPRPTVIDGVDPDPRLSRSLGYAARTMTTFEHIPVQIAQRLIAYMRVQESLGVPGEPLGSLGRPLSRAPCRCDSQRTCMSRHNLLDDRQA